MKIRIVGLKLMLLFAGVVIALFTTAFVHVLPQNLIVIYHTPMQAWTATTGVLIAVVSFFVALVYAWQLLRRVDTNTAFSRQAVTNLRHLKWAVCGITIGLCGIMPQVYVVAQGEDAPGLILIAGAVVMLPFMVGVFLAILERLWAQALAFKDENELTI